jgi:hypothetical protein
MDTNSLTQCSIEEASIYRQPHLVQPRGSHRDTDSSLQPGGDLRDIGSITAALGGLKEKK